jgi:ATP-binding cassette subfamily F protein 3
MPIVSLNDIHVAFGSKVVFDKLRLAFYPHEKVALVGPNGCGKTTLLKLILGTEQADIGTVRTRKNLRFGYLPQSTERLTAKYQADDDKTVIEELHSTVRDIGRLQKNIHDSAEQMSWLEGAELTAATKKYDRLCREFEVRGGYNYEIRIKEIAAGLGLDEKFYNLKTSQLSGGQKSRLGLAKVLLADADLLLLDEPTNNLDFEATMWLEDFLKRFDGAAVIVSHDRFLLDRLVTKTIEIRNRSATVYPGNYTNYRKEKQKRDLEFERQYRRRVEFVEHTRDFIARNKDQEGMRKVARGRKKQLDDLLRAEPDFLAKPAYERHFDFEFAPVEQKSQRAQTILSCEDLTKRFDSVTLFEDLNFEVLTGQRLGIIGPNGSGKTTLLKLALGHEQPTSGRIELKPNVSIGYLDQAGAELDDENTVLEEAATVLPDSLPERVRGRLGAFLFSGDDVFKRVGQLSGGERNRLALCKLVLSGPQVLILDEPTNHLDIPSIEALEGALQNYTGTIIVVSHDRFLLDKVAEQLLVLGVDEFGKRKDGCYELVIGSFSQYAQLLNERRQAKTEEPSKQKKAKPGRSQKTTPEELLQFAMWSFERLEKCIEETEGQITELTDRFGDTTIYKNPQDVAALQKQLNERKHHLELLYRAYEHKLNA